MGIENNQVKCDFCGQERSDGKIRFVIGASRPDDPDWTIVEGTGKMTCPYCYQIAMKEGQAVIEKVISGNIS